MKKLIAELRALNIGNDKKIIDVIKAVHKIFTNNNILIPSKLKARMIACTTIEEIIRVIQEYTDDEDNKMENGIKKPPTPPKNKKK
jgi:hypothetical protein